MYVYDFATTQSNIKSVSTEVSQIEMPLMGLMVLKISYTGIEVSSPYNLVLHLE